MNNLFPALCTAFLFAACGSDAQKTPTAPTAPKGAVDAHQDDGHGEKKPLGNLTVGEHTFAVIQFGKIEAGHEAAIEIEFPAGKTVPSTVRAWIGIESGEGSMKAKLGKEGEHGLHGHIEVPKTIPAGSKVWVEIEAATGSAKAALSYLP